MTCILDDDEADIEAEIQRELDALGDDSLHIEDVENDSSTLKTDEVCSIRLDLTELCRVFFLLNLRLIF